MGTAKGINSITGVDMSKLDRAHLEKVLDDLKVKYEKDATDVQLTMYARSYFDEKTKKEDLVECDKCHGISSLDLDSCPYCGADEHDDDSSSGQTETKKADAPKSEPETKTTKKEATMGATAKKDDKGKKSTALAAVPNTKPVSGKEAELNKRVENVIRMKGDAAASMWVLGGEIRALYEENLWKHRNDAKGSPRYKSWESFVNIELGMTPQNAYKLLDIHKHFTEEKVRAFGTSKLGLVLEAPKEDQAKVMRDVEKGATKAKVTETVRKLKKDKGHTRPSRDGTKRDTTAATQARKEKKPKAKEITIAKILGRQVVKLYHKPTTKTFDLKTLKPAKRIADHPWGTYELANDVTMEFYVQETSGGLLQLVVTTKRDES